MPATFYTNRDAPAAGAGLRSTPRDYAAFLRAYHNHQLLPEALRTEMETDQFPEATRTAFGRQTTRGSSRIPLPPAACSLAPSLSRPPPPSVL